MSDPSAIEQPHTEDGVLQLMELFAKIFDCDLPKLRLICKSYVPIDEIEDVLGKVRLEICCEIKRHGKLPIDTEELTKHEASIRWHGYIRTLIERRAIDRWRQTKRERKVTPLENVASEETTAPGDWENVFLAKQIAQEVTRRLEKTDALLFALCILRDFKSAEAGEIVGLSPQAVRKRISRTIRPTLRAVACDYGCALTESDDEISNIDSMG